MEDEYDCVVLGTGLKECILSGLLSVHGYKVLHMDRNNYYGGESASLNLTQLWEKFKPGETAPERLGHNRYWNVDLIPKLILASGRLTKMLIHTDVTRYLEFKSVEGSYVFTNGVLAKAPANDKEALRSSIFGWMEKMRARKFFLFLQDWRPDDANTHQGIDTDKVPVVEVFKHFGLQDSSIDYIGHAMALYRDDTYLQKPARECFQRVHLYLESTVRYGRSPYIYPLYGLGELPQAFARLSAIYGGTYMLAQPYDGVETDDNGVAIGVKSGDSVAKCKFIVGDPSYFPDRTKKIGQVIRCICVLQQPIPGTDNAESGQIILPGNQIGRKHDVYITCVSAGHHVVAEGRHLAIVSTTVETSDPEAELAVGLKMIGRTEYRFISVSDLFEPLEDGTKDKVYITKSYDATSHFETSSADVQEIFERITGKPLDMSKKVRGTMEEETAAYLAEAAEQQQQ